MTYLLAIDPGPTECGYVLLDDDRGIVTGAILTTADMIRAVEKWAGDLAIEMIASYGMPVGAEVFETCVLIGRLMQAYPDPDSVKRIKRADVKLHVCGSARAKDANVRQALLDLFGPQGTKANPGPTYGLKSHMWPALGVAATVRGIR